VFWRSAVIKNKANIPLDHELNSYNNTSNIKTVFNNFSKFVCIVDDLDDLRNNLRELGFENVNAGPQSTRGCIENLLTNTLCLLDLNFRSSMYFHNQIFAFNKSGEIKYIPFNRFNFENIHINLGYG
jgi:hypothetical protein